MASDETVKDPASEAPAVAADPAELKDSSSESLSKAFRAMSAKAKDALKNYRPTLEKLNEFVSKFQSIPVDRVGIEIANFDRLREYNLMTRPGSGDNSLYAILTIYDSRFLIRVQEENKIVTYTENINKPSSGIQYLDSDEFWYRTERSSGGTLKVIKSEPKFNVYDLGKEEDVVNFMSAIAETTAALAAKDDLRSLDVPPQEEGKSLPKASFQGLKPKRA